MTEENQIMFRQVYLNFYWYVLSYENELYIINLRFGRKKTAYALIIGSSFSYIMLSILLNLSINITVKLVLFGALRLVIGLVSSFYPIATVLGIFFYTHIVNNLKQENGFKSVTFW